MIINSMHLLRDDHDGNDLLELIQQRAEQWCATSLITVILNSDDYWVYERLKQHATRMDVVTVTDLSKAKAIAALKLYRRKWHADEPDERILLDIYEQVGGRMAYLSHVAKASDMIQACKDVCAREKTWFLNKCWILGEPMDDDVMDQQKYAVSLAKKGSRPRSTVRLFSSVFSWRQAQRKRWRSSLSSITD